MEYVLLRRTPPSTLVPTPSITSDLQEVAYASLFIRTWGNTWFVICVQRREHIFSYVSTPPYIHPYIVVDVFYVGNFSLWRKAFIQKKKKKNYEGTIFSLSTVMKNRCKRCRGDRLKAILCNFFCIENSSADRYHSRWCFSVYSTCFVSFVL